MRFTWVSGECVGPDAPQSTPPTHFPPDANPKRIALHPTRYTLFVHHESRELCERAVQGDDEAREALLGQHLASLRAFVRARLGDSLRARETSQDISQSVCREALEDLGRFEYRGEHSFRSWLFQLAENKLRDRGRYWSRDKRSSKREANATTLEATDALGSGSLCTPSRQAVSREELERVESALVSLSEDQRTVIVLARLLGLPHAEIARRMGRTVLATRTLLSRSLARLATVLAES